MAKRLSTILEDSDISKDNKQAFDQGHQAVGECLMAWATVELQLNLVFLALSGAMGGGASGRLQSANIAWSTPKSFDARMDVLKSALDQAKLKVPVRTDCLMLFEQARVQAKSRNQIAHSTLFVGHKDGHAYPEIEPFFFITARKARLGLKEIQAVTSRFRSLADSLVWLLLTRLNQLSPQVAKQIPSLTRLPDLVREIREQQSQLDKVQQAQQRDLRLVSQLRKLGKWPPPELAKKPPRRAVKAERKALLKKRASKSE
ncbi:MAG: hypothetical protein Q8R02_04850 [Hyphomonadaceae bacterium]|nr:hypothetical protein [Hyphomonadaceae bacterium]